MCTDAPPDPTKTARLFDFMEQNGWIVSAEKKLPEATASPGGPGGMGGGGGSASTPAHSSLFTPTQLASMSAIDASALLMPALHSGTGMENKRD